MADRTVKVRLVADISDFVTDIGVKAVAAVKRLEGAASSVDGTLKKTTAGASKDVEQLGSKADATSKKVAKIGDGAQVSGSKISAAAAKAKTELDKVAASTDKVEKATAAASKTSTVAAKNADSHANALGRLRVAQLKLAEVQKKSNPSASAVAGAEESVKAAERAVKKFEKAGDDSGRGFTAGLKKWVTGDGKGLGSSFGTVFGSGFLGALKTPILGPALIAILTAAVVTAAPAVGAVAGGAFVTGFGGGLAALALVFAAQNERVKAVWTDTLGQLGRDMQLLSAPFQSVLVNIAGYFKRTVDDFNPYLAKAFSDLAQPVNQFANDFAAGLEKLIPAIGPLTSAFSAVLADLGPALTDMLSSLSDGMIKLANSVEQNPQALGDFVRGLGDLANTALGFITTLNEINTGFEQLTRGTSLVEVVMKGLQGALAPLIGLFEGVNKGVQLLNALTHGAEASGASMSAAAANTVKLAQAQGGLGDAAKHAGPAVLTAAEALERAKQKAQEARDQFERFIATTFRLQNQLLSLSGAQISFQAAIDAASASVKENGRTLDITTDKGRNNQTALNDLAKAANAQTEAMIRSGSGNVSAAAAAERSRGSFVKLGMQMGLSRADANRMAAAMIAIPNVTREARLQANKQDLDRKLADARAQLADPKLTATKRAKLEATIAQLLAAKATAQAAIDSLHGKTVALTVTTYKNLVQTTIDRGLVASGKGVPQADGGYWPKGIPSYANGKLPSQAMVAPGKGRGMVQWAEAETGGEAFIPLAPSKRDRSEKILGQVANSFGMGLVKSFASGGFNLPGGNLVDVAFLIRQLGLPFDPVAGVNYTSTLAAANRANRATVAPRAAAIRADKSEQAAKAQVAAIQRAITLQQRAITAARAGKPTTKAGQAAEDRKVAAEQKKLIALQDGLYKAKIRSTAATKASNAADAVYKVRVDAAAKAAEAHKAAIEKLIEQQKAAVDLANQISSGLTQGANIGDLFQKSLTGKGLLSDLQNQGASLKQFGALITQLRSKKLNEDLIQQIIGKGAGQGTNLAQAILGGGAALVDALNKAQKSLEDQANLIGAGSAVAQFGTKVAGARAGGGGVSAGMTYRVNEKGQEFFTAPINGHVIPAGVDPRRYITSIAGFGGGGSSSTREVHVHQSNYFTGVSMAEADLIAQRANAKAELAARGY